MRDFPSSTENKNLPAKAGDMGSIPGLGRSHIPEQLSPGATTAKDHAPGDCDQQPEKPPQGEAQAPQPRGAPTRLN